MQNSKIRQMSLTGILTALVVVLGRFVMLPTPTGFLIDLVAGYPQWMFHSLIAHSVQGYFAGWRGRKRWLGVVIGSFIMIFGYFLGSLTLGYGLSGSLAGIWGNVMQNTLGLFVGFIIFKAILRQKKR
ncbi:ECF transporter S component [Streptococcus pyogenes]|uniref:ECF transporter S component n=1 Tax=Streptococcus pyogenes TaxID=1314 RepID=UPI00109CFC4C|nr:ECF transporter S component [Streptococcus pyogenes]VGV27206.1 Substrate-specific component PdxU2 of pyridoxin-related ECF transporter [Streptococcus pyogenes]VHA71070.1 Substrate-specific component PdxU2 of pyridoxin-related ECF transporter [Streptococcus pyogenes]VHA78757.1 Substrate-specific component PdxU2 of pyridoxin-related ECF transporter [Streptococcus pyogenes]VHB75390.1 Substrate-specific component PdxU2 of pyridoxin-related ECF transporter [Streptococcus pyogenes]VHD12017.1 Subs